MHIGGFDHLCVHGDRSMQAKTKLDFLRFFSFGLAEHGVPKLLPIALLQPLDTRLW